MAHPHTQAPPITGPVPPLRATLVRTAQSVEPDTARALHAVLDEVEAESAELVMVFFSERHDLQVLAEVLDARTGARGVAGSSAGELGPLGFTEGGMSALSLQGDQVRASLEIVPHLTKLSLLPLANIPEMLARRIGRSAQELTSDRHLWLTLLDSRSRRESLITPFFAHLSPQLGLVGGSLGAEDASFGEPILIHHGRIFHDAGAFALVEYERPFHTFHTTHMSFGESWFKVTRASEDGLTLHELDGRPAVDALAGALGVAAQELSFVLTSQHPFGVRFRGRAFPVATLRTLESGGLVLASPVHPGERVNVLEPGDIVERSREAVAEAIARVGGEARGMLLFHCISRHVDAQQKHRLKELFEAMHQAPLCGFNTLGEQYGAMHVNHSMTGVVFG